MSAAAVTRDALLRDLRERRFRPSRLGGDAARRVGAEVEFLPLSAQTGAPWSMDHGRPTSSLGFLRRYGGSRGWVEDVGASGAPRFLLPDGGALSFEPGGQIEYSTPACASASQLLALLRGTVAPLVAAAREEGVEWRSVGIDPINPLECAPLQIQSARYLAMADYFATIGPAGAAMMRQTAAFHLNLDFEDAGPARYRLLNAAAPQLIAIFANSPIYARRLTGHASHRAHVWRETDPSRTGILPGRDGPSEYLEFCLEAPAILKGPVDGRYLPFGDWVDRGAATLEDWGQHLLNVYPDVRPRGYLEVRSADAIAPEWHAAPIALLAGITYHAPSARAAADLLGDPDPERLRRAGELGLRDTTLASTARDLFAIGLAGSAALGDRFLGAADLEVARAFYDRYTRRGTSPANDVQTTAAF